MRVDIISWFLLILNTFIDRLQLSQDYLVSNFFTKQEQDVTVFNTETTTAEIIADIISEDKLLKIKKLLLIAE